MRAATRRPLGFALVAALAAATVVSSVRAQSPPTRTVLTVHWSTEDFPSTPIVDAGIREALRADSGTPIDYFAEYLESDRFPAEEASAALRDYIKRKFKERRIDVVLAVSEPALEFVQRYRDELFPGAPVVASVAGLPPADARTADSGLTGLVGGVAYDKTLDLALTMHPQVKQVFVVAHAPTIKFSHVVRKELETFAGRVQLVYVDEPSVDRLLATIKSIPRDSLVLYVRHSQEDDGDVLYPVDVARLVSQVSPVPVYGANESYFGTGVVGGVFPSRTQRGRRLGQMTRQLLAGVRAQDIPMEPVALTALVDWRQVVRARIDPSLIPSSAEVRFRELTVWQQYHGYIVGAAALLVTQSTLIGALLIQQRRRRRAERELDQAHAELNRVSRLIALGEFAAAIAHEVRQPLHAIILTARSCLHQIQAARPDLDEVRAGLEDVVDAGQRAGEVIKRNRELFRNQSVQTSELDINQVISEAALLVQTRLTEHHVTLTTVLAKDLPAVGGDRIELEQVLLNLIANAIDAMEQIDPRMRRIIVSSTRAADGIKVAVSDNGVGLANVDLQRMFSLSYTTKANGTGVGLSISRSIIHAHGGRLWAEQAPGGGATFCFALPLVRNTGRPHAGTKAILVAPWPDSRGPGVV